MSRLIDADKLKEELKANGLGYQYYMLDNAPTVKAIPIEWMYEWRIKNNEQYNVGVSSFSQMISDWEKENETNRR